MKVLCEGCISEIEVDCYVYEQRIITTHNPISNKEVYTAVANIKFFCSECGRLHDYKGVTKELSYLEIGKKVESIFPFYVENRLKELKK